MARCDSYVQGQCTWGACELAAWLPESLGNATDWVARALQDGLQVVSDPVPGAIVVYAAGDGYSEFGHVGYVVSVASPDSFQVREMNFAGAYIYDDRWSNRYDVEGFILPPGGAGGQGALLAGGGESGGDPVADTALAWQFFAGFFSDVLPLLAGKLAGLQTMLGPGLGI